MHLAGLEEADQLLPQTNRHRRIHQAQLAGHRGGLKPGAFRELLLHLQAGSAGPAFFRQHGAEGILVALAVMGQLPRFHRAQRDGQTGGFAEGLLVILEDFRVDQALDQVLVVVPVHWLLSRWLHKICYHVSKLAPAPAPRN